MKAKSTEGVFRYGLNFALYRFWNTCNGFQRRIEWQNEGILQEQVSLVQFALILSKVWFCDVYFAARYSTFEDEEEYAAVTQFEPTDARRCFPCWDEPSFKATFNVTLVVPKHLVALSNMVIVCKWLIIVFVFLWNIFSN